MRCKWLTGVISVVCMAILLNGCGGGSKPAEPAKPAPPKAPAGPDIPVDPPVKAQLGVLNLTFQKLAGSNYQVENYTFPKSIVRYQDKLVYADGKNNIVALNVGGGKAWPDKDTFKEGRLSSGKDDWGSGPVTVDKDAKLYFCSNRQVKVYRGGQVQDFGRAYLGDFYMAPDAKNAYVIASYMLKRYPVTGDKLGPEKDLKHEFSTITALALDKDGKLFALGYGKANDKDNHPRWGVFTSEGQNQPLYGSDAKDDPTWLSRNPRTIALTDKYVVIASQYYLVVWTKEGKPVGKLELRPLFKGDEIQALGGWDGKSVMLAMSGTKDGKYVCDFYQLTLE